MKKNLLYSGITILLRVIGRFALIFILARLYTLNDFGVFTYSLTIAGILILFFDFGYNIKILNEIPKGEELIASTIGKAVLIKLVLVFSVIIFILLINLESALNIDTGDELETVICFVIISIVSSFTNLFILPFKATNKYHIESLIIGFESIFTLLFVLGVFLYSNENFLFSIYAYLIVKILTLILAIYFYFKNYNLIFENINIFKELTVLLPFGLHFFLGGLYLMVDTVILKIFVSNEKLAIYQAGLRILMASSMLLTIINSVFLPRLSLLKIEDSEFFIETQRLNRIVFFIGAVISVFSLCFSEFIILTLFGPNFLPLQEIFIYFILIIFLRYCTSVYGILLTISNKQKIRAWIVLVAFLFIIVGDYFLIPEYEIKGSILVLLFAHVFIFLTKTFYTYKSYNTLFLFGRNKND